DLEHDPEPRRRQEADRIRGKRKHCIGRNRAAVKDQPCLTQQRRTVGESELFSNRFKCVDDVLAGCCRSGRRLRNACAAALAIETEDIGEGAAYIDAQDVAQGRALRRRHFISFAASSTGLFVNTMFNGRAAGTEPAPTSAALRVSMVRGSNLNASVVTDFPLS